MSQLSLNLSIQPRIIADRANLIVLFLFLSQSSPSDSGEKEEEDEKEPEDDFGVWLCRAGWIGGFRCSITALLGLEGFDLGSQARRFQTF